MRGNSLPPSILNRFHILLAILRQIHLVCSIALFGDELRSLKPDVFIVDQLSACVPLLRWVFPGRQRILFYCHFPDQLLVKDRGTGALGTIKKIYRLPFDWFEEWSTGASDIIVVNSNFTKNIAQQIFTTLEREYDVIYPCVSLDQQEEKTKEGPLWDGKYKILLSINRFERKKDIGLAIRAYGALSAAERKSTRLVIAGGYDSRIQENVRYHQELVDMAGNAGLKATTAKTIPTALAVPSDVEVLFMLSIPGVFKETLLQNASLLLYTPSNEHFGIVPVEAMQYGVPVLASNSGGPLETVVTGKTGWLRDAEQVGEWTAVIRKVLSGMTKEQLDSICVKAKRRVANNFTRPKMALRFQEQIYHMLEEPRPIFTERQEVVQGLAMVGVFIAGLIAAIIQMMAHTDPRATEFARVNKEDRLLEETPRLVFG